MKITKEFLRKMITETVQEANAGEQVPSLKGIVNGITIRAAQIDKIVKELRKNPGDINAQLPSLEVNIKELIDFLQKAAQHYGTRSVEIP